MSALWALCKTVDPLIVTRVSDSIAQTNFGPAQARGSGLVEFSQALGRAHIGPVTGVEAGADPPTLHGAA